MLAQPKACWQSGLVYIREVLKAEADFASDYKTTPSHFLF